MRQRAVWMRRVTAFSWTEVHAGRSVLIMETDSYENGNWVEPQKRLDGSPFMLEKTIDASHYKPMRDVTRRRYGMLFVLRPIDTWDMFERMARAKHSEWRDDAPGPYLTRSQEEALRRRGEFVFPPMYTPGQAAGLWEWSGCQDLKKWGLPHWIQVVLGSRWWSDRMGVGNILILPPREGVPARVASRWQNSKTAVGSTFSLKTSSQSPCGVALELLRERNKKDPPVNTLRFRAFAHRFWGEERARVLTEGIF